MLGCASGALLPVEEEFAIAIGEAGGGINVELDDGAVDPSGRAFELDVVADGGLVDDEMCGVFCGVGPFGAEFFVDKGWGVAELLEDFCEGVAVGYGRFGFDADFIAVVAGELVGHALVREGAELAVVADAKDLPVGAEIVGRGVVEGVELEGAGGVEMEAELRQARLEGCGIGDGEFEFYL